ncbi:hypothetical protein Tco_0623792 [Tanacetum coccineum]|uniref:Uncharacterized protein n=1 Tax=Tanacetum coccineum TaxID=301880 RepID=A0ABQ4WC10_9ASTR
MEALSRYLDYLVSEKDLDMPYLASSNTATWVGFPWSGATTFIIISISFNLLDLLYLRIVIFMDMAYVDRRDTPYWELVKRRVPCEESAADTPLTFVGYAYGPEC